MVSRWALDVEWELLSFDWGWSSLTGESPVRTTTTPGVTTWTRAPHSCMQVAAVAEVGWFGLKRRSGGFGPFRLQGNSSGLWSGRKEVSTRHRPRLMRPSFTRRQPKPKRFGTSIRMIEQATDPDQRRRPARDRTGRIWIRASSSRLTYRLRTSTRLQQVPRNAGFVRVIQRSGGSGACDCKQFSPPADPKCRITLARGRIVSATTMQPHRAIGDEPTLPADVSSRDRRSRRQRRLSTANGGAGERLPGWGPAQDGPERHTRVGPRAPRH